MSELRSIQIKTSDQKFQIRAVYLAVKNFSGVIRKMKGQDIIGIVKLEEGRYLAFVEE